MDNLNFFCIFNSKKYQKESKLMHELEIQKQKEEYERIQWIDAEIF